MWNAKQVHLHFGLEKPIRILHLTDAHIVFANGDECEANKAFAVWRKPVFDVSGETPSRLLEMGLEYGREFDCTVITETLWIETGFVGLFAFFVGMLCLL